jgi:hypothetical protein
MELATLRHHFVLIDFNNPSISEDPLVRNVFINPSPSLPREGDRDRILFICYYSFLFHSSLKEHLAAVDDVNTLLFKLRIES